MEIYYCKNKNDLKKIAVYILNSDYNESTEEALESAMIYGCTCDLPEDYDNDYRCCIDCGFEDETLDGRCLLFERLEENKNINSNIILSSQIDETAFPCIVIVSADNNYKRYSIIVSINELKDNTKYGCNCSY